MAKQHTMIAEEAVEGWEKAEAEVVVLKQQLEAASHKNSTLEERVGRLDSALKECMRQLHQTSEEHDKKLQEAVAKRDCEWESSKSALEKQIIELKTKLNAAKADVTSDSIQHNLRLKLEVAEKENFKFKLKIDSLSEELKAMTLERDLSTRAVEVACKQHFESMKKVANLEVRCRKLHAAASKMPIGDSKSIFGSTHVESLTEIQSDLGRQAPASRIDARRINSEPGEYEPSCSDSWASALRSEFDQFNDDKAIQKISSVVSPDMDLMDDFLEMEKLASLVDIDKDGHSSELSAVTDCGDRDISTSKSEHENLLQKTEELVEKLKKLEEDKAAMELGLIERQDLLEKSESQLMKAGQELVELQRQLDCANEAKNQMKLELEDANVMCGEVKSKLDAMELEVQTLRERVCSLELEIQEEQTLSKELAIKCGKLEDELSKKQDEAELKHGVISTNYPDTKHEKELAVAAGKLAECQKTIASLGQQLKGLATAEDFLIDADMPVSSEGVSSLTGEEGTSYSDNSYSSREVDPSNDVNTISSSGIKDGKSPPLSSSSPSTNHDSEKSRKGFQKLFFRSKNSINRVEK